MVRPAVQPPAYRPGQAVHVPRELARLAVQPVEDLPPLPDADWVGSSPILRALRQASPEAVNLVNPNVRINDTAGDSTGSTQSETSIASLGNRLVAGWNDGTNFSVNPGASGYGYSTDMGASWTDGGVPPAAGLNDRYEGDPSLTVDAAGNFYYANLYTPDGGTTSVISVNRGQFSGSSFSFNPPVVVASTTVDFLDKEWIAADPATGILYLSWTRFLGAGGTQIELSRSTDNGATWSAPLVLTNSALEDVQGSRPAVGPTGEVYVVYFVYDFGASNSYIRIRKSTNQGVSFGSEVTVGAGAPPIFSNFGSGPPGFNRTGAVGFPGITVDRSASANSGRAYVTWEESVDYFSDPLGYGAFVAESEPNGLSDPPDPFNLGDALAGSLSSTSDQDWYSFNGTAGQTVVLYLVPNPTSDGYLRLFCSGRNTPDRVALSYLGGGQGLIVFTLPSTGTYYLRVLALSATLGNYVVYTGVHVPSASDVGRDHRDVVFSSSMDGTNWTPKRVVNDDPPLFDNTFPEVAVDGLGDAYFDWYDHRLDPGCGIGTDIFYTYSGDGGATFVPSVQVNDGGSINWSNVSTNLAPNMGDYSALVADGTNIYANFADGRQGSPDSWVAKITAAAPCGVSVSGDTLLCAGDSLHLAAVGSPPGGYYVWTGPNGFFSSQQNPQIPDAGGAASGTYTVFYYAAACTTSNSIDVVVEDPSCVIFDPDSTRAECGTSGNQLCVSASGAVSYAWSLPYADPGWMITGGQASSCVTYTAGAGGFAEFKVVVTSAAGCRDSCFYADSCQGQVAVESGRPFRPALYACSPNPVRARTSIGFDLAEPGAVRLTVYGVDGRVVARLLNGEFRPAGRYRVEFRAGGLPPGLYFYQLKTSSFVGTRRMLILK